MFLVVSPVSAGNLQAASSRSMEFPAYTQKAANVKHDLLRRHFCAVAPKVDEEALPCPGLPFSGPASPLLKLDNAMRRPAYRGCLYDRDRGGGDTTRPRKRNSEEEGR